MSTPTPPPLCRLLALPGELRNRIYRFTLLEETPIIVTYTGFARPGLMNTCKEIRTETIKIYYEENKFMVHMVNLSSDALISYEESLDHVASGYGTSRDSFDLRSCADFQPVGPGRNWPNHLETMRRVYAGELDMGCLHLCDASEGGRGLKDTASLMMHNMATLVTLLKKKPWSVVEKVMLDQRVIMNSAGFMFDEQ